MDRHTKKLRVIFWGSPHIAVPFLGLLYEHEQVVGIVTRPDKASGRGHVVHQTAVAEASPHGLPIQKPVSLKDPEVVSWIASLAADAGVVVAYGGIIPPEILSIPAYGFINIHFSLLPKYRGPAPIQHALLNGEKETGVTSFFLEKDVDAGPILVQKKVFIDENDDAESLADKLVPAGLCVLRESLDLIRQKQDAGSTQVGVPTSAPLIRKEHGRIAWTTSTARSVNDQVRALKGWPYAFTHLPDGSVLKVIRSEVCRSIENINTSKADMPLPGTIIRIVKDKGFIVQCTDTCLLISRVIPEGRKEMSAWDFINGRPIRIGDLLR